MRNRKVRAFIATLLIPSLVMSPMLTLADDMADAANEAKTFGGGERSSFNMPSESGGAIEWEDAKGKTRSDEQSGLTPFTSGELDDSRTAPGGINHDTSKYEDAGSNEATMEQGGNNAKRDLFQDADKEEPETIQGQAFKTAVEGTDRNRQHFENDPIFQPGSKTHEALSKTDQFEDDFSDCSMAESFDKTTNTGEISNHKSCSKVVDLSGTCDIQHNYEIEPIIAHVGGEFKIKRCGDGCIDLMIGKEGNNYWGGSCVFRENKTVIKVMRPDVIESAKYVEAQWDDHIRTYLEQGGDSELIYQGPDSNRWPTSSDIGCELETSWNKNPGVDVTDIFQNANPSQAMTFRNEVMVAGNGEGYGRIRIRFDKSEAIIDEWVGDECKRSLEGLEDGFAEGDISCVGVPGNTEGDGCTETKFGDICRSDLKDPPTDDATAALEGVDDIDPLCKEVRVETNYDYYKGQMDCYINHTTGEEVCPTNDGSGSLDTCEQYEDDPNCGFVSQECVEGSRGSTSGRCYVYDQVFNCPTEVEYDDIEKETNLACSSEIRCVGDECADNSTEQSESFQEAAALLNSAQFIQEDMNCDDLESGGGCKAFAGEALKCGVALGGPGKLDCCDLPSQTGVDTFLKGMVAVKKLDSNLTALGTDPNKGGVVAPEGFQSGSEAYVQARDAVIDGAEATWEGISSQLQGPATSAADAVQPVTDAVTTVKDHATDVATDISETAQHYKKQIQNKVNEWLSSIKDSLNITEGAGSGAGGGGLGGGGGQAGVETTNNFLDEEVKNQTQSMTEQVLGEAGAGYLSAAMTAYSAVMLTYSALQMAFPCTEEAYELSSKQDTKSCTKAGSYCSEEALGVCVEKMDVYCCFNSPLSRIIQEQVEQQLDINPDFGSGRNPKCQGIPLSRMSEIDWSKVDLTEWVAMQSDAGILPEPGDLNMERITGSGSHLDVSEIEGADERRNSVERSKDMFKGTDPDASRNDVSNKMDVYRGEPGKSPDEFD